MNRRFNTAGPNDPGDHHTLPVLARLPDLRHRIDEKLYFVLHAPRQAGKTTALLALTRELTGEGRYAAVVLSMASGAPFREEPGMAEDAILDAWQGAASRRLPPALQPPAWPSAPPGHRLARALQAWAEASPRPLVVFLDDIDALGPAALVSVLRQLRDGFSDRPHHFPWSLILTGMRDAPDYQIAAGPDGHAGAVDPFDVRSDSLTLPDFSREAVAALYGQHTADTGQVFLPSAIDRVYRLTRGQPWLVSALARRLVEEIVQDRATAISATDVELARDLLVRGHQAHFDSLAEQLHEPRLRAILAPMLRGELLGVVADEDRRLALDFGMVRSSAEGALAIANPIYREVLVRLLASGRRPAPPHITATWVLAEDLLDDAWPEPAEPVVATPAPPTLTPEPALPMVARGPLESLSPEELTEWFRPIALAPPESLEADEATGSRLQWRSRARRTLAFGGAGLALVTALVWLAGGGAHPAAATPAGAWSVARVSTDTAPPAETPQSAPAAKPAGDPGAPPESAPARPHARGRLPVAATLVAYGLPPLRQVVPSGPSMSPLDEDKTRRELEPKVWAGQASLDEIRMLKAICSNAGDHGCRDRAHEMLRRREP